MEDFPTEEETFDEPAIEDGDRILYTNLASETKFLNASITTSQCLAEAFQKNSQPKDAANSIPPYLQNYGDVFSKDAFDKLPVRKS